MNQLGQNVFLVDSHGELIIGFRISAKGVRDSEARRMTSNQQKNPGLLRRDQDF